MWIEINKDVFENSDIKGLSYIFQVLSWFPKTKSRYNVFIDLDQVRHTQNYELLKGLDSSFDENIEQQFNDFITSNPANKKRDFTISNIVGSKNFNIEEAIRFFNQPISIILENNKNDAYFLKALFYHFDPNNTLIEHIENGWIKFENAGGCSNVRNFIEGELKSFEDLAYRNNRNPQEYYRSFIVLDSDKEYLAQPQKQQYNVLISFLVDIGITIKNYHILQKRMMENYMPKEVFEDLRDSFRGKQNKKELFDWINVYLNLNDEQKDFLNIKSGFSKEKDENGIRKPLSTNINNLYNIPQKDFSILDNGFKYSDFKNAFSELFYSSAKVNKVSLANRSNSNEFNEILDKINEML